MLAFLSNLGSYSMENLTSEMGDETPFPTKIGCVRGTLIT